MAENEICEICERTAEVYEDYGGHWLCNNCSSTSLICMCGNIILDESVEQNNCTDTYYCDDCVVICGEYRCVICNYCEKCCICGRIKTDLCLLRLIVFKNIRKSKSNIRLPIELIRMLSSFLR